MSPIADADGHGEPRLADDARQRLGVWLQPTRPEHFTPERFPVFNLEVEDGRYYGFPVVVVPGFKFGRYHHREEHMPAEALRREPDGEDEALLRAFAARHFPGRQRADHGAAHLHVHQYA